jgi:molybdopterin-containing oxidoreductase family iron-sulfur binding subunit
VYSGLLADETGMLCNWQAPATHYLESWTDGRAYDGTVSISQPLIAPLYENFSAHEILALISDENVKSPHDQVHDYWQSQRPEKGQAFTAFWETSLHDGVVAGSALAVSGATLRSDFAQQAPASPAASGLEVAFRPDPTIGDGEYSNNGWLQETPKTITRLTWDNAVMISAATAQQLGLSTDDYVTLQLNGREAKGGVLIVPGHADNAVTVHLGYGRSHGGHLSQGAGFNANLIRTAAAPWIASGLQVKKTGDNYPLATVQHQYAIDSDSHTEDFASDTALRRDLVQIGNIEDFKKDPTFAQNEGNQVEYHGPSLYPNFKYDGYAWGMSIDLNRCVGCNACVVACTSENNIAVVGKDQVARARSMHWIRIDTYFRGGLDNPEVYYEPLPCMQCENAPCEYVCPVGATTHSPEGLNDMTYNRCVGTRYCSNNCPYKVRRFNFYLFSDYETESLKGVRNPNVTVRSRGVMEKCTYCVQRINAAKIRSEVENNRTIADGEIVTACQQACPAEAIVFGNINDPNSRVAKLKAQTRNYGLLTDLNTRPRTTYLARVRNPNPEIRA